MLRVNLQLPIIHLLRVVILCGVTALTAVGQSYYHSPNDTLIAETEVGHQVTMNITQVHPTNDTLQFVWEKLSVSLPEGWTATICDNVTCYPDLVNNGTTLPVLPGDDGFMLIHCQCNTTAGTGIIRYKIYEVHSPEQVDTLSWIIHAVATTGITDQEIDSGNYFTLNDGSLHLSETAIGFDWLRIIHLSGKTVFESNIHPDSDLLLPKELRGTYIIQLQGTTGTISRQLWF